MKHACAARYAAATLLALALACSCPAEDPPSTQVPRNSKELFGVMIEMLGAFEVSVAERYRVMDMLCRIEDRQDLIGILIDHVED